MTPKNTGEFFSKFLLISSNCFIAIRADSIKGISLIFFPFPIILKVSKPSTSIIFNCSASLITKITLDMGFVILIGSSFSFLGLGVQPPTPDLGTMVSQGSKYLPDIWWLSVFPGLAILVIVLGFNLLGDGLKDLFDVEL